MSENNQTNKFPTNNLDLQSLVAFHFERLPISVLWQWTYSLLIENRNLKEKISDINQIYCVCDSIRLTLETYTSSLKEKLIQSCAVNQLNNSMCFQIQEQERRLGFLYNQFNLLKLNKSGNSNTETYLPGLNTQRSLFNTSNTSSTSFNSKDNSTSSNFSPKIDQKGFHKVIKVPAVKPHVDSRNLAKFYPDNPCFKNFQVLNSELQYLKPTTSNSVNTLTNKAQVNDDKSATFKQAIETVMKINVRRKRESTFVVDKHPAKKPKFLTICSWPQCTECFDDLNSLKEHEKSHVIEQGYVGKCDWPNCGARFNSQNDMVRHRQIHVGEKPFRCEECGMQFSEEGDFNCHKLSHNLQVQQKQCNQVNVETLNHDSSYNSSQSLMYGNSLLVNETTNDGRASTGSEHILVDCDVIVEEGQGVVNLKKSSEGELHETEADSCYQTCRLPDCTFRTRSILKINEHEEMHIATNIWQCNIEKCRKQYKSYRGLLIHQRGHYGPLGLFCLMPKCLQQFTSYAELQKHQEKTGHLSAHYKKASTSCIKESPI